MDQGRGLGGAWGEGAEGDPVQADGGIAPWSADSQSRGNVGRASGETAELAGK